LKSPLNANIAASLEEDVLLGNESSLNLDRMLLFLRLLECHCKPQLLAKTRDASRSQYKFDEVVASPSVFYLTQTKTASINQSENQKNSRQPHLR